MVAVLTLTLKNIYNYRANQQETVERQFSAAEILINERRSLLNPGADPGNFEGGGG